MYKGSCLCASIQFELHGGITDPIYCHCSLCRKASGSAFATNGDVNKSNLHLNDAKGTLTYYESSEGKRKYFCSTCGAPIYSSNSVKPDKLRIRLGIIDSDIVERPISHNFITSKGNWEELEINLPMYEGHEPSRK
ncbi:Putative glutathione-dependent formaldehyde-activating enzyme [Marinomonas spartinae]|uniref:GFA family protein n=1 Tax=Marinomonas spartinae TaxID=1792290 RepID=UPI000808B849|nr:GFA family protein [Marinomonas spartinae]SBS27040.1 Putative glutathione-dependent formaldehyde-activating enzyme [Marinomonas spartinae]